MEKILKVGHYWNSGDLVSLLPGLRHLYLVEGTKTIIYQRMNLPAFHDGNEHEVKRDDGLNTSMNQYMFDMLDPLLRVQPYILDWLEWKGEQVDYDSLKTRDTRLVPIPNSDIYFWNFFLFPQLTCDLSERWLNIPHSNNIFNDLIISDHVIVNRTYRYTNPYISYFFLKKYQDNVIFSGTENEHRNFCKQFELDIPRLNIVNFLELAQAIDSCRFFLGNQSLNFHLANGLKTKRIVECCGSFPNTLPHGKDGWAFFHQTSLEVLFEKLFNNEPL